MFAARALPTLRLSAALGRRHLVLPAPIAANVPAVDYIIDLDGRAGKSRPSKAPAIVRNIYCIGRNYAAHARELGNAVPTEEPVIFMKSSAALRGLDGSPKDPREKTPPLAFPDEDFHHEIEMVTLIGKDVELNGLYPGRETECITGIGLGLDLTRRPVQDVLKKAGKPWTTAKSFAGSAIVGPIVQWEKSEYGLDELGFELSVNGKLRQKGDTSNMIFDVPSQLRFINSLVPLLRGDLIFTGTPEGVNTLRKGDKFVMSWTKGPLGGKNKDKPVHYKGSL